MADDDAELEMMTTDIIEQKRKRQLEADMDLSPMITKEILNEQEYERKQPGQQEAEREANRQKAATPKTTEEIEKIPNAHDLWLTARARELNLETDKLMRKDAAAREQSKLAAAPADFNQWLSEKTVGRVAPWSKEARSVKARKSIAAEEAFARKIKEAETGAGYWKQYGQASKYSADTLAAFQTARHTAIGYQTSLEKEQARAASLRDARQKLYGTTPMAGVSIPSQGSYFSQLSVGFSQPQQQQYQQPSQSTGMENAMNTALMYNMLGMGGSGGSSQNNATLNSMLGLGSAPQGQQSNTRSLYAMLGMSVPAPAKVYAAQPRRAFKKAYTRPYKKPYTAQYNRPASPARKPFTQFKKRTTSYSNYAKPYARPEAPAKRPFKQYRSYKPQSTSYSKFSKFKKPWQGKATSQKKSWYADKAPWERKATYKPAWKSKPKFGSWKKKTAWKGKTFKKKKWTNWKRR